MSAAKFVLSQRLLIALAVSALLHGALIYGVRLPKAPPHSFVVPLIEARIVSVDTTASQAVPAPMAHVVQPSAVPPVPEAPAPARTEAQSVPASHPVPAREAVGEPLLAVDNTAGAIVTDGRARLLAPVEPVYPEQARARGITGRVTLLLSIDEDGKVSEATVVVADPAGVFEESALTAFRAARFSPAIKAGRAVPSRMMLQVFFDLNESRSVR